MQFEFATASQIIFGSGTLQRLGELAANFGQRALIVGGNSGNRTRLVREILSKTSITWIEYHVNREPTVEIIREGISICSDESCDLIIAIGGGSVLDAGKAISALATNRGDIYDYLEVIGLGKKIAKPPLPFIAIPTTAGTGTEVTRNAVVGSLEHEVKVSLRSPMMLPKLAIIDPELTHSVPPEITAYTGMDALTQLIEPYVCNLPNPIVDALALDGIRLVAHYLIRAYLDGADGQAREKMALASLYGGFCLANARLGAVHGFAGPIGGMVPAPHGAICARFLPIVMEANIGALLEGRGYQEYLLRYEYLAKLLTGDENASVSDGVRWAYNMRDTLQIPKLSSYGFTLNHVARLVEKVVQSSSMKGNPVQLRELEIEALMLQESS